MLKCFRSHVVRKAERKAEEMAQVAMVECGNTCYRRARPRPLRLLFLFCTFSLALHLLNLYSVLPFFRGSESTPDSDCSSSSRGSIFCDRTGYRSDICYLSGDIRTSSVTSSIILYNSTTSNGETVPVSSSKEEVIERIRPYTRKWETSIMETIDELQLISRSRDNDTLNACQVQHCVPAIVFSTGGYTGNIYHEFNDGIIPLFITSQKYNRSVVFVILEYRKWWITKYRDILSHLSAYPPIDFAHNHSVHCFPKMIVGLQIHDELTVTKSSMPNDKTIQDFRNLLDKSYEPRIRGLIKEELESGVPSANDPHEIINEPKLVILSRNGSRAITNERDVVELAKEIGFHVEVLRPTPSTELAKIYRVLSSSDVMVGVHGAAMTHLLFMRAESVFIQVIPLGTDWAAQTYYGNPALKLGLHYIAYVISPKESSLSEKYRSDDPVLRNPRSLTKKGWHMTKSVYLDQQNVRLDLARFRKRLIRAYEYSIARRRDLQQIQK